MIKEYSGILSVDELNKLITESRQHRIPFIIRDFYKPMFDWNFTIDFLNQCMADLKENTYITKIGDYYFILQPSNNYDHIYSDYYKLINTSHPNGVISIPVILVSIFNNVPNLNEHADPLDQMHLAIYGSSNWKLTLDNDEVYRTVLKPGDFIFMPILIKHEVTSVTPRIGLTFSANKDLTI